MYGFKYKLKRLPDFFKGELVGVMFHVLYGGVSEILLPDGGVPSMNWTFIKFCKIWLNK